MRLPGPYTGADREGGGRFRGSPIQGLTERGVGGSGGPLYRG